VQYSWTVQESAGQVVAADAGIAGSSDRRERHWTFRNPTSGFVFTWDHEETSAAGNSTLSVSVHGYRDAVLALR
jgi:hypothetical protein